MGPMGTIKDSQCRVWVSIIPEARKLEHHYPHALKVKYKGSSTHPPKVLFQLSGFYHNANQTDRLSPYP